MKSEEAVRQRIEHLENHKSFLRAQKEADYISEYEWIEATRQFNMRIHELKWMLGEKYLEDVY
jgi:hypothetical protein